MPTPIDIGKKISSLRWAKRLTQEELAKRIGTTTAAIGNYEAGIRVPKDSLKIAIAKELDASVEEIFFTD